MRWKVWARLPHLVLTSVESAVVHEDALEWLDALARVHCDGAHLAAELAAELVADRVPLEERVRRFLRDNVTVGG